MNYVLGSRDETQLSARGLQCVNVSVATLYNQLFINESSFSVNEKFISI